MSSLYETRGLSRRYHRGGATVAALEDVSLTVAPGELLAVVGPSGCGKTTLLQILGLVDAGFGGELRFEGHDVRRLSEHQRARLRLSRIGLVIQSAQLVEALTVLENVALPLWRLHGSRQRAEQRARALVAQMDLDAQRDRRPHLLSTGEMQRAAVARALSCEPAVILADEPTASLDAANAERIMSALAGVAAEGRTVIIATHDPLVMRRAHRTITLGYGRIIEGS